VKRALDRGFDPPAPMVPARVRAPGGADWEALSAKVDTGADLSAVPDRVLEALDVAPVRVVRAATFTGALQEVPVYRVDLELAGELLPRVEALATRRPYVIAGRNVLRHFVVKIDGPREQIELRRPT
jgi:predicted aspartyl protease